MCKRPLTPQEQKALISRFTVPNSLTTGRPQSDGINVVISWFGFPGGFVTTTRSSDGLSGRNVTTPFHVFTGTVERSIVNTPDGAYMQTHGYGGYGSANLQPQPINVSGLIAGLGPGFSVDYGEMLDSINNVVGPEVFNHVDKQATRYAKHHFPGCD